MNVHFTNQKKLTFNEHYKLFENEPSNQMITVLMGSISGDIITIMKSISRDCEELNRHDVYIYEGSTLDDFSYCVVPS